MNHLRKKYRIAILVSTFVVVARAGTEKSERVSTDAPERGSTEVSVSQAAKYRRCGFPELSPGVRGREVARLMEPPFMAPKEPSVLPQQYIKEYTSEPYVLRYQVVEVDAQRFRDFLQRESKVESQECWATVELKIFDEEPVEVFRDTLVVPYQTTVSGYGAWVGRSQGDVIYSFQFVVEPNDTVSMQIESNAKFFQVNVAKSPPYHVLWEWDTEFFGPPAE